MAREIEAVIDAIISALEELRRSGTVSWPPDEIEVAFADGQRLVFTIGGQRKEGDILLESDTGFAIQKEAMEQDGQ